MNIGERIQARRKELNLSVDELAKRLNKNRTTVYRYEKGDIENLPLGALKPLAEILQTSPAYLMGWEDKPDDDAATVSDFVKLIRTQRNMSVEDFSKEIGISPEKLREYESREKYIPISVINLKLYIEDFEMKLDNLPDSNENEISNQIDLLNREIHKIERKLSKLFDSWEDEKITDNEFVERKTVHNKRIESIKEEIENLEYTIPEKEEYQEKIVLLSEALAVLKDDSLDAEIKNEYLKRIVDTIEFSRENNSEFILDINLC